MKDIYDSKPYKRSRLAYYIQCVSEYLVALLVADTFLAKLLKSIEMDDATIGIVSSLTSLAFLIQLVTILLLNHIKNTKRTVILIDVSSMVCFTLTYFLPFFNISSTFRTILVFLCIGGGFLLKYLQLNIYYKWGNSFVRPTGRGSFSAKNEAISLAIGVVFVLIMGNIVDYYEKNGNISISFIIIAITMALLTILDFIMLLSIKGLSKDDEIQEKVKCKEVIKNTLGNKNFRNVIIMVSIYDIGRYLLVGFLGTFKIQDLLLTVGVVQIINVVANLLRCILSKYFGKLADKTSFAYVYRMGLWICAIACLFLIFTTKSTWFLIIGYTICYNVSMAGTGSNANNMTYSYVPIKYYVQAQAIRSSIGGTIGFMASLLGSYILSSVQANGNVVFGISVYGQQILAILSFVVIICTILFNKFVVSKQKVMIQ